MKTYLNAKKLELHLTPLIHTLHARAATKIGILQSRIA
jgi:hypothetical protein